MTRSPDTSLEADRVQTDRFRSMTVAQKLEMIDGLNALARAAALSGLRERHPGATSVEIQWRLARLLIGRELADAVFEMRRVRRIDPA